MVDDVELLLLVVVWIGGIVAVVVAVETSIDETIASRSSDLMSSACNPAVEELAGWNFKFFSKKKKSKETNLLFFTTML